MMLRPPLQDQSAGRRRRIAPPGSVTRVKKHNLAEELEER